MAQQLDKPLDARIPEAFVAAEPVVGALERAGVDADLVDAATHRAFHESGPLQGLDVLRRRGERHPMRRRELADGLLTLGEPREHRAPGVITVRLNFIRPGRPIYTSYRVAAHFRSSRQAAGRYPPAPTVRSSCHFR